MYYFYKNINEITIMIESEIIKNITQSKITHVSSLGKEIKISPKSHISYMEPGYKVEYFVPTVEVLIGIGKDHTASLIMDQQALGALQSGEKIHITTSKEFKKTYLK